MLSFGLVQQTIHTGFFHGGETLIKHSFFFFTVTSTTGCELIESPLPLQCRY